MFPSRIRLLPVAFLLLLAGPTFGQYLMARYQFSRPGIKVTYTRSFGNPQAKVTRRASAADGERKRVTE